MKKLTIKIKLDLLKERRKTARNLYGVPGRGHKTFFIDERKHADKMRCRTDNEDDCEETHDEEE